MRKKVNKKLIVALLSFVLLFGGTFGSSLAWLLDKTENVDNTFTTSNIDIELDESDDLDLKMIPGWAIDKDPYVTVKKGSEDCWVFIEVFEENSLDKYITYAIDENNWTQLNNAEKNDKGEERIVYYTYSKDITADRNIKILGGGSTADGEYSWESQQVLVNPTVKKEDMDSLTTSQTLPKLSFKAYATQYWKNNDTAFEVEDAWKILNP